jgi:HAD superfamily hydrolase (TIGR01509 family)
LTPEQKVKLEKDLYDLEMEGASRAVPVPGAHELLEWLDKKAIPWAVVSRNCMDSIKEAARRCDIPLPEHVFSRDEGPLKPDPEALWAAAEALGVSSGECVVVGDFLYDLYGARRAGMRAVLVERHEEEWVRWADAGFERLTDLVASLGMPEPLIPWEYKNLVQSRGEGWLKKAWKLELSVSGASSSHPTKEFPWSSGTRHPFCRGIGRGAFSWKDCAGSWEKDIPRSKYVRARKVLRCRVGRKRLTAFWQV